MTVDQKLLILKELIHTGNSATIHHHNTVLPLCRVIKILNDRYVIIGYRKSVLNLQYKVLEVEDIDTLSPTVQRHRPHWVRILARIIPL